MGLNHGSRTTRIAVQLAPRRAVPVAMMLTVVAALSGCAQYGTSHYTYLEETHRPWVAPGVRAEGIGMDSWDLVKGSSSAFGYRHGSRRWINQNISGDLQSYVHSLDLPNFREANYVVVSLSPTCGLMKEGQIKEMRGARRTGPFEGQWAWFSAPRARTADREPPIPAVEGEPFSPPGAKYSLILRDGYVYAIERSD